MISLKSVAVLVAAGALVAVGAQSAGAAQATVHSPTAGAHVHIKGLGGAHPDTAIRSSVGAGYWSTPGGNNVSSASVQFTIPAFGCDSHNSGFFPGIWIYDSSGNLQQQVDVNLFCSGGTAYTHDVLCIAGSPEGCVQDQLSMSPGDRIAVTFSESSWATQGQIADLTTGQYSYIYDGPPAPTTDYTVFLGNAGPAPFGFSTRVPVFSSVPFTKAQVDGYYLYEYVPYSTVLKSASVVQIKTGGLRGDGDTFTTTFTHV